VSLESMSPVHTAERRRRRFLATNSGRVWPLGDRVLPCRVRRVRPSSPVVETSPSPFASGLREVNQCNQRRSKLIYYTNRLELIAAKRAGLSKTEIESIKSRHKAEVLADSKRRQTMMDAERMWLKSYDELCAVPRDYSPI
jgi:hypothetical protein